MFHKSYVILILCVLILLSIVPLRFFVYVVVVEPLSLIILNTCTVIEWSANKAVVDIVLTSIKFEDEVDANQNHESGSWPTCELQCHVT